MLVFCNQRFYLSVFLTQTHDFTEKLSPGSVLLFGQTCLFSRFVRDFLTYLAMRLSIILFFVYLI